MKFFDYKFLILLGLTLVVYFLYREVEVIKNKLKKYDLLEDKKGKNDTENEGDDNLLQIELPPNPDDNKVEVDMEESKLVQENVQKVINIPLKLGTDSKKEVMDNTELNDENNNLTSSNSEVDVNVYSNTSEKLEIYSNDDEEDNDSSVIISLEDIPKKKTKMESSEGSDNRLNEENNQLEINDSEEMKIENSKNINEDEDNDEVDDKVEDNNVNNNLQEDNNSLDEDDIKSSINDLLKNNKLAELQDKAKSLGIITTKMEKNKSKNKTKLELAKDIVNKKNN